MNALLAKYEAYLLTAVACLIVGFGAGWTVHGWEMKASQAHAVQTQAHQVVKTVEKQGQVTAKIEASDAKKQQQIHTVFRTLEREVPAHVTPEVDRQYPVSNRLVGVLDRALAVPAVPDSAGSADDAPAAPSAVAESDLGAWATQVIEQYNSTRQQLIDLQAWVQAQYTGRIPKEQSMVDWEQMVKDGEAEMVGGRLYKNRVEVGRLVDGKFVETDGGADAGPSPARTEPVVQAAQAVDPNAPAPALAVDPVHTHTVTEGPTLTLAEVQASEAQSLGPAEPQAHEVKPGDRPAVDAAAMLGD